MRRLPSLPWLLPLLAACMIGTPASNYAPARGPAGAILELRLADGTRMNAELLAVEDSAFLLLHDAHLVRVPLSQLQSGKGPKVSFSGELRAATRERLRLISRYPQGVSAELEGKLREAWPGEALAPPGSAEVDSFAARARQSTLRYRDQAEALKDGYRRIGPDFPSMGEHWLNQALVVRNEIDPLRPPILEYITVGGHPVLAGVAYASLAYGHAPHSAIPARPTAWHYHAGSVDEESFIASHAAGGAADTTPGARIAVLHAWLWADNPAGLFATDNWALPWLRLGLTPPADGAGADSVTLMAALAAGGERYFTTMLRLRDGLDAAATERVAGILAEYADRLRAGQPTPSELAAAWPGVSGELRKVCGDCSLRPRAH